MGEWMYIDPHFFDLGISWRLVVRFTPLPLYPPVKEPLVCIGYDSGWNPESVWTDPRAGLDEGGEEKIIDVTRTRTLIPRSSSP
jgi:hypothetical protein